MRQVDKAINVRTDIGEFLGGWDGNPKGAGE